MAKETAAQVSEMLEEAAAKAGDAKPESPETASKEEVEASNLEAEEQVSHEEAEKTPYHKLPRFKELVDEKNTALETVKQTQERLTALEGQNSKLIEMLDASNQDTAVVQKIRDLATSSEDERVQGAIDTLEKAISGQLEAIEEKAAEAVKEGSLTVEQAQAMVNKASSKLEDQLVTQQADMLWDRAKNIASSWLGNLPEEYTEADVSALDEMFHNRVDWEAIDGSPDQMSAELYKAFEQAIEDYGEPRGTIVKAIQEAEEEVAEETKELSEDEIVQQIRDIEWGKMDDEGKPKISGDEFVKQMGKVMRFGRD